jgi:hypothetical protein
MYRQNRRQNNMLKISPGIFRIRVTIQAIYVQGNAEARSRNHCYHGKALSLTYFCVCVCVCVVVGARARAYACSVYACSVTNPACNAPPYCRLWPLWLYHIFRHYLINGTILAKYVLNIKCVFWFSLQLLSKTFLILRRIRRDIVINVKSYSCKVPVILVGF